VVNHSSTSNSSPSIRDIIPKALILAGLIVFACELIVRFLNPLTLISYEGGMPGYWTSRILLEKGFAPDIMIVGSSRTQQGVVPSVFMRQLEHQFDRPIRVGNYAQGGASSTELISMIKFALKQEKHPKVILWGMTPSQFAKSEPYSDRSAVFWSLAEWTEASKSSGKLQWNYLPTVVRNEIGRVYKTFEYRHYPLLQLRAFAKKLMSKPYSNPMLGGRSARHYGKQSSLQITPHLIRDLRSHIDDEHLVEGKFPFSIKKMRQIQEIAQLCQEAGVTLIFFDAPSSPLWNEYLPQNVYPQYYSYVKEYLSDMAPYIYLSNSDIALTNEKFRDTSHLTYKGATYYTSELYKRCSEVIIDCLDASSNSDSKI